MRRQQHRRPSQRRARPATTCTRASEARARSCGSVPTGATYRPAATWRWRIAFWQSSDRLLTNSSDQGGDQGASVSASTPDATRAGVVARRPPQVPLRLRRARRTPAHRMLYHPAPRSIRIARRHAAGSTLRTAVSLSSDSTSARTSASPARVPPNIAGPASQVSTGAAGRAAEFDDALTAEP